MLGSGAVIFASVGSMLPFERFVRAVDEWAGDHPQEEVFIQIGETGYEPRHAPFARMIPMADYRERLQSCDLFVAHVGMGSILQALQLRKQMLMLPRLQKLGEHTTDHQLHTAARFAHTKGILIVDDIVSLQREMSHLLVEPLETGEGISDSASPELIGHVTTFLADIRPRH